MKRKKYVPKKKAKKNAYMYFLGALIILIMVGGAINMDSDSAESYDYNGIKFVKINEGWLANLDAGKQVFVLNSPAELKNMTLPKISFYGLNTMQKVYISYNPEERVRTALSQFTKGIPLMPRLVPACTVDVPLCADVPIRTCKDATETVGVIEFRQANETTVEFKNNCLLIQGEDLTKIVDKLILEQI